ncbi:MAG: DUF4836 family protein [Ferruginibacter sp.]
MQPRQLSLLLIATAAILFSSCSKTNTQGKLIPKEAAFVMVADGKALASKLSWDQIKANPLLKDIYADSTVPSTVKSVLDNPENAGIEIAGDLILFVQKDSTGGYLGFEGKVKDEAKFKKFNTDATEGGNESEDNGIHYINKAPVSIGWDKDKFVYVVDLPDMRNQDQWERLMKRDSIDLPPSTAKARDVYSTCKKIFALSEGNSLAKNEKFTKLMKQGGDIRCWLNTEEIYTGAASLAPLAMLNLDKIYKGSLTTFIVNFDNGKITLNSESYSGPEITNLYKKYGGGKVSEEMLKRMPGKDVAGVMAFNFNPKGLEEFIKLLGVDGFVNLGLKELGITMDDFIKANKGDIMVGVADISMKTDTLKYLITEDQPAPVVTKPDVNYIFAASIGDEAAFNKLISAGKALGGRFGISEKPPFEYNSNGKYFVISNTKANTDKYLAGSGNNFDFISKISGEPFGGYLNLQTIMKTFGAEASKDSTAQAIYEASLKMWDNVLWKAGKMEGDVMTQNVEINLLDKSVNSLRQLNEYSNKLSLLYKQKKQQEEAARIAYEDFEETHPADSVIQAK